MRFGLYLAPFHPPTSTSSLPSHVTGRGSRVCKHPTQSFPVFLYQAAGLRQPVKISTYFCSPEVRPRITGPPGPSRPISPVHESFTQESLSAGYTPPMERGREGTRRARPCPHRDDSLV